MANIMLSKDEEILAIQDRLRYISNLISKSVNNDNESEFNRRVLGSFQFNPDPALSTLDSGSTAWMLMASILVFMMTMPGLALYYAGMVSSKNVLAIAMQMATITCMITIMWFAFGYSLAFAPVAPANSREFEALGLTESAYTANSYHPAGNYLYGDGSRLWLRGMTLTTVHQLSGNIPEPVFCMFQLTFAIITPGLMCGSFADRMRYWPMVLFVALYHILVYIPIAHALWHPDGFLFKLGTHVFPSFESIVYLRLAPFTNNDCSGALDFAGGNVVHISSGMAGLMACYVIGKSASL